MFKGAAGEQTEILIVNGSGLIDSEPARESQLLIFSYHLDFIPGFSSHVLFCRSAARKVWRMS